mgnify:FL=1
MASFIGYDKAKIAGVFSATIGVIIPSLLSVILVSYYLFKYKDTEYIKNIIFVLKDILIGLITIVFFRIINEVLIKSLHNTYAFFSILIIALLTFSFIYIFKINPIYIIICSFIGAILYTYIKSIL